MPLPPQGPGGAGSSPAGGSAGVSAGQVSPPFIVPQPLPPLGGAVWWDARQRTFTENPDGTSLFVHPVDQRVQLLITIEQGAIPSLGAVGQRYRQRLVGIPMNQIPTVVLDETKVALAALLNAGDILLYGVDTDASVRGAVKIRVRYKNLRLPPTQGTTSTPSPTTIIGIGP